MIFGKRQILGRLFRVFCLQNFRMVIIGLRVTWYLLIMECRIGGSGSSLADSHWNRGVSDPDSRMYTQSPTRKLKKKLSKTQKKARSVAILAVEEEDGRKKGKK
uniref:Uncharacterized protein n=1 Tax=Anthurium amnicola TaxID=1678845 RepID=A0A1D1YPH5_9ARAE